jgi:hypothetical protein
MHERISVTLAGKRSSHEKNNAEVGKHLALASALVVFKSSVDYQYRIRHQS